MKHFPCACAIVMALLALSVSDVLGDEPVAGQEADRAAVSAAITAYVKAFNDRDAPGLAAHWSVDGVYTSRTSGARIVGRAAMEKDFVDLFAANENVKLQVSTESIEFVSPNVAVESGTAKIMRSDEEPEETAYTVVYVKRDGKWLIDRTSEEDNSPPPSHYEQLKQLEWMVGDWLDQEGGSAIRTTCKWTRNNNFLVRTFTAAVDDAIDLTGMQFIGYDAARQEIRSWVFDSDGGFSEGTWAERDGRWYVQTKATLPDGSLGSSTSILRSIDENSFGWQQTNRVVNGELLPNIDEVIIVRE